MTKCSVLGILVLSLSSTAALALSDADFRQKAQSACMMDVMTLCASSIPDETSIIACMNTRRSQLSAPCRDVFDIGSRSYRRRQTMR